jgi:mannosyltransferase OCH1-like enzyme
MTDQTVIDFFGPSSSFRRSVWSANDMEWGHVIVRQYCHEQLQQQQQLLPLPLQNDNDDDRISIPKSIHWIWLGPHAMPEEPMASWIKHHCDFHQTLWTDHHVYNTTTTTKDAGTWFNQAALFYAMDHGMYGMASDILRLEILYQYGGVYIDIDYYCVDSILPLLKRGKNFVCGASNTGCVELNNGWMASTARQNDGVIQRMMQNIHDWFVTETVRSQSLAATMHFLDPTSRAALEQAQQLTPSNVIEHTGPGLLTRTIGNMLTTKLHDNNETQQSASLSILHHKVLHPIPNSIRGDAAMNAMEMYSCPSVTKAIHLWACSWQTITRQETTTLIATISSPKREKYPTILPNTS